MARHTDRIQRDYSKAFFSKRSKRTWRLYYIILMSALILAVPVLAYMQRDVITLRALDIVGMAPTSTPLASTNATQGDLLFKAGDVRGAADYYEIAVTQQPQNVNYLYEYGRVLIELNQQTRAAELGERIMELAPDDPRGYALKANATMWSDPTSAIPAAITGTELGIRFAPLHGALAVAYTQIGRYQEALQHGDLATRIDPMDASARRSYSYPLIFVGDYNAAIRQLEEAVAAAPNLPGPYFELASLYRRINQSEMAVAIYNRVLEIQPNNAQAYLRLCETYAAVGLFQEGEPFCDRALLIDPEYASAHRMRGQLRYTRRNYEGAIEAFEECLALTPEGSRPEIECYYIRGWAHYLLGHCDRAWDILTEALELATDQQIIDDIRTGLTNVTLRCAGYQGRLLPTQIPPTPIPPTPIGGF